MIFVRIDKEKYLLPINMLYDKLLKVKNTHVLILWEGALIESLKDMRIMEEKL